MSKVCIRSYLILNLRGPKILLGGYMPPDPLDNAFIQLPLQTQILDRTLHGTDQVGLSCTLNDRVETLLEQQLTCCQAVLQLLYRYGSHSLNL